MTKPSLLGVIGIGIGVAVCALRVPALADFPVPPHDARYAVSNRGVLTDWGVGQRGGALAIRTATGKRWYAFSDRIAIDGKRVVCASPPRDGKPRDPVMCDSWPATVVLGKTLVRVRYWVNAHPSDPGETLVADSLTTH